MLASASEQAGASITHAAEQPSPSATHALGGLALGRVEDAGADPAPDGGRRRADARALEPVVAAEAAHDVGELAPVDVPDDALARAELHVELTRLLAETDPPAAREHAAQALAVAPIPGAIRERLADIPALATRHNDPDWRELLAPAE